MPISGLVIVLDERADAGGAALDRVRADDRFTVGPVARKRAAAVLETRTDEESRERLAWLERLPGVAMVQIASVDRSDVGSGREDVPHGG